MLYCSFFTLIVISGHFGLKVAFKACFNAMIAFISRHYAQRMGSENSWPCKLVFFFLHQAFFGCFGGSRSSWAWAGGRTSASGQQHLQVDQQQPNLWNKRSASTLSGRRQQAEIVPWTRFHPAHAQKCAVLSINSGHAVALPAAPHFIVVLRWKDPLVGPPPRRCRLFP